MKASIFQSFVQWKEDKSLIIIVKSIKEGKYKEPVEVIRTNIAQGNKELADELKKKLPAFTPSGTFRNGRKANLLSEYSGHVILDIDDISDTQIANTIQNAALQPSTFAAFISPSGNGVKIMVAVSSPAEHHKAAFSQVATHYQKALQVVIDPSGKDVSRLCFMSYDPNCYRNINTTAFIVQIVESAEALVFQPEINEAIEPPVVNTPSQETELQDWETVFNSCIVLTEQKSKYSEGNRNNFIYSLACNCNRSGIPQALAESLIKKSYNLEEKEIVQATQSTYKNNVDDFAKVANLANIATLPSETPKSKDELLMSMPFLPETIYDKLPHVLTEGCRVLKDRREKDIFITGALSILSGCMRNVLGLYRGKEHYSNLFVFVIAPPASGKGAITFSKQLGDKYHDKLVAASQKDKKIYDAELAAYKVALYGSKSKGKLKEEPAPEPPDEPPFKVLFIPANNSSARIIQHMKEGDEQGIFCETEADTMGNVLKQDWGSYSDLLRKAFHHESVSYSRKTNKEWIELKMPRLSVCLAGTPGQVEGLIKSAEDGLFSRFMFYVFKADCVWVKAGPTMDGVNLTKHFEALSNQVLNFVEFLANQQQIQFHLTDPQWEILNTFGESSLTTLSTFISEDLASTSKRLGLVLFRVCMVLTALRYFDNAESGNEYTCTDDDFDIALQMVKVYEQHAIFMFNELPKAATVTDKALKTYFDALPQKFRRKEAITIAEEKLGIKSRSADTYLSKLVTNKWLSQPIIGNYEKTIK